MLTHPLIGDLSSKTTEELEEIINRLNKNLAFVGRTNNQQMFNQLLMTINTYREEYRRRQDEIWNKKSGDLNGKIDIS
jgi:hypothetical protein